MARQIYETTAMRAILALVAGSIVGSVLIIAGFLIPEIIDALNGDKIAIAQLHALPYGVIVFVFVYAIFTAGIVLIGLPIWALMHQLGRRNWLDALLLGGIASFLVTLAFSTMSIWLLPYGSDYSASDGGVPTVVHNHITAQGWTYYLEMSGGIALAGIMAALTIWRIAYRKMIVA